MSEPAGQSLPIESERTSEVTEPPLPQLSEWMSEPAERSFPIESKWTSKITELPLPPTSKWMREAAGPSFPIESELTSQATEPPFPSSSRWMSGATEPPSPPASEWMPEAPRREPPRNLPELVNRRDVSRVSSQRGASFYPERMIHFADGELRAAKYQPVAPVQPVQPIQPSVSPFQPATEGTGGLGASFAALAGFSEEQFSERFESLASPTTEGMGKQEMATTALPDLGSALAGSNSVQSTKVQRRSPISFDPNIRGFKAGQVYAQAGGVYWTPARRDLDTMLSKIDPGMIQDAVVIPGPYGLRYGPGFAFIHVVREPTPRYACGSEVHFETNGMVRTNGGQLYGRETVYGGGSDWGFRMSYGHRRGNDYDSGNGLPIPSSYESRDVWGELSYDINPHQHVDFSYQRLDQTDTEYPGQFFDIGHLGTYGFELRVVDDDPDGPWSKLSVETWYNRTGFRGSTAGKYNPSFLDIERVNWGLDIHHGHTPNDLNDIDSRLSGDTNGSVSSSGARAAMTFGEPDETHTRLGADFRYLGQAIGEHYTSTGIPDQPPPQGPHDPRLDDFTTNMPHSWLIDPGFYAEWSSPLTDWWSVSIGSRVDFVSTRARASDVRANTDLPYGDQSLEQGDTLYAFYLQNEFDLRDDWTLRAGFGHAQRPPTLVERYADSLFLGILQSGYTRVIGDQTLKPERNWQIDVGLSTTRDRCRFSANVFHSWVIDYVTMEDGSVVIAPQQFPDARRVNFTNTPLATLTGFETAGELDLSSCLTTFGAISYVEGRDETLGAPLGAIPPLESTVGLRLHDRHQGRHWGIELACRIVDDQNRLGMLRSFGQAVTAEEATPGFALWHLRGYWNRTERCSFVGGIDNLFDRNYQEHLDLRLRGPTDPTNPGDPRNFPSDTTRVLSPGFTPYVGVNWVY